jgi:hypothetical protein
MLTSTERVVTTAGFYIGFVCMAGIHAELRFCYDSNAYRLQCTIFALEALA